MRVWYYVKGGFSTAMATTERCLKL